MIAVVTFNREFHHQGSTYRFVITTAPGRGWEVREERDGELLHHHRYLDWHRVEFARACFALTAAGLKGRGWLDRLAES